MKRFDAVAQAQAVKDPVALLAAYDHGFRDDGWRAPRHKRPAGLRRANLRWPPQALDEFVFELLRRIREERPENDRIYVRREGVAAHLSVPEHFVDQALERLKLRGILNTPINHAAHDSPRAGMMGGPNSAWTGSVWTVRTDRLDAHLEADAPGDADGPLVSPRRRARGPRP